MPSIAFRLMSMVISLLLLTACSHQPSSKPDFTPDARHLSQSLAAAPVAPIIPAIPPVVVPSPTPPAVSDEPKIPYQLNLVRAEVRPVLHRLAQLAGIQLDIEGSVTGKLSVHLQGDAPLRLIEQICEQTDLMLEQVGLGRDHYRVRLDQPVWMTHQIDSINLDRQVSSSLMVTNALGSISGRTTQSITLGGQTNQTPVAITQGSNTALLNQSKYDMWHSLTQGIRLVLRAKHPELLMMTEQKTEVISDSKDKQDKGGSAEHTSITQQQQGDVAEQTQTLTLLTAIQDDASVRVRQMYPAGTRVQDVIHASREGGFVAVFAPQRTQQQVAELVGKTKQSIERQLVIEATILEVELNDEHQAGVNWQALVDGQGLSIISAFTGRDQNDFTSGQSAGLVSMTGSAISKDFSLTSTLKLLERYGQSRVLSSPKLMTMNHQPSIIKVVKNLVYFTIQAQVIAGQTGQSSTRAYVSTPNTVPIGLVMSVVPSISADQHITLAIRPTISSLSGVVDDPNPDLGDIPNRVPIIQERELESVLSLRDGQIAVLGGLIQDVMAEEDTGIPGLVSAPTAGFLFGQRNKAKRKSELVVFLKPTLVAAR